MTQLSRASLISVIEPVHQAAGTLTRCIESLRRQSHRNLEILLVDDGSTDHSSALCDAFAARNSRIRTIHRRNGGLSSARNAGLAAMRGLLVGFVDADDCVAPTMDADLARALLEHDADIAQTGHHVTNEDGTILHTRTYSPITYHTREQMFQVRFDGEKIHTGTWSKLYRSSLFDELRFKEGYLFEDYALLPLLFREARRLVVIGGAHYYYYTFNPRSLTREEATKNYIESRLAMPLHVLDLISSIHPPSIDAAHGYICDSCIDGLLKLRHSRRISSKDKADLERNLRRQHRDYLPLYRQTARFKRRGMRVRLAHHLFALAPGLASALYCRAHGSPSQRGVAAPPPLTPTG